MDSVREQLRKGVAFTKEVKPYMNRIIHKVTGKCSTTEEGFCEFDLNEHENFFLLKPSWNHSKRCKGGVR